MAGLKANSQAASQNVNAVKPASSSIAAKAGPSSAGPSTGTASSHARPRHLHPPIPPIITQQQPPHQPGKKQQKKGQNGADLDPPPVSPITPPLPPLKSTTPIPLPTIPPNFASMGGRAPLTHVSHPTTVPAAPAPPVPLEPVDFENNTDVIAVQATIGILLQQRKRAQEDIRTLRAAKAAAIARPMEFLSDLSGGSVKQPGVGASTKEPQEHGENTDEEDAEGQEEGQQNGDVETTNDQNGHAAKATNGVDGVKPSVTKGKIAAKGKGKAVASSSSVAPASVPSPTQTKPWANLPTKQSVVRLPPINWAQYAVEGDALNRIHHEQTTAPTRGTPAVIGANGTYEFTGAANPDDGKKVDGISAPYDAFKDQIGNKPVTTPNKKAAPSTKTGGPSRRGGA